MTDTSVMKKFKYYHSKLNKISEEQSLSIFFRYHKVVKSLIR